MDGRNTDTALDQEAHNAAVKRRARLDGERGVSPTQQQRNVFGFIDVGRTNMGLCFVSNVRDWSDPIVEMLARVDIDSLEVRTRPLPRTIETHKAAAAAPSSSLSVVAATRTGRRTRSTPAPETADLVAAFVTKWSHTFDACERIYLERQPPAGMRDIEQLLYAGLGGGARVAFLPPRTIHAYFRMGRAQGWAKYEDRKVRSEILAHRYIQFNGCERARQQWRTLGERRHDVSDATLMSIYVQEQERQEWCRQESLLSGITPQQTQLIYDTDATATRHDRTSPTNDRRGKRLLPVEPDVSHPAPRGATPKRPRHETRVIIKSPYFASYSQCRNGLL